MDAKTSSNKINAFRSNFFIALGNNKRLIIISAILSILGLPLAVLANIIRIKEISLRTLIENSSFYYNETYGYYIMISVMALCLLLIVVLVSAFNTFRYMYDKPMVDVVMSLPVTANQRFFSDYLAGFSTFAIPFVVSAIPAFIVNAIGFSICSQWSEIQGDETTALIILKLYITGLLTMFMLYSSAILILSICGSIFESILYTVVFNVIIPVIISAVYSMAETCIYGLSAANDMLSTLSKTTFIGGLVYITMLFDTFYSDLKYYSYDEYVGLSEWVIAFILISVIITAAAYFLYKNRKAEDVSKPFAFGWAYYIIMIMVCFCMMCGMFISMENDGYSIAIPWIIMTFIMFIILDTIQNRGFKKFLIGLVKFAAITGGSCLLIFTYTATEGYGAAKYVPSANSVKSVEIEFDNQIHSHRSNSVTALLEEESDILHILDIHNNLIDYHYDEKRIYDKYNHYINIDYTLKSGRHIRRRYYELCDADFITLLNYQTNDEYLKELKNNLINETTKDEDNQYRVFITERLTSSYFDETNIDYETLIDCYINDYRNADFEKILESGNVLGYFCYCPIYDSFSNTIEYLKSKGIDLESDEIKEKVRQELYLNEGAEISVVNNPDRMRNEKGYLFSGTIGNYSYSYEKDESEPRTSYYIDNDALLDKAAEMLCNSRNVFYTNDADAMIIVYKGDYYLVADEYKAVVNEIVKDNDRVLQEYYYYE